LRFFPPTLFDKLVTAVTMAPFPTSRAKRLLLEVAIACFLHATWLPAAIHPTFKKNLTYNTSYNFLYFLGLPTYREAWRGCRNSAPRRLVLRQIERLVRTLNEVKDQLVPKSSKKLPKKNEQAHSQKVGGAGRMG